MTVFVVVCAVVGGLFVVALWPPKRRRGPTVPLVSPVDRPRQERAQGAPSASGSPATQQAPPSDGSTLVNLLVLNSVLQSSDSHAHVETSHHDIAPSFDTSTAPSYDSGPSYDTGSSSYDSGGGFDGGSSGGGSDGGW